MNTTSPSSFEERIIAQGGPLKAFAIKLTQDMEKASDLIQETYAKALSNKEKFKEGTNLRAWLMTIMRNTFITDYHKNTKRNVLMDTSESGFINEYGGSVTNEAQNIFIGSDIDEALNNLEKKFSTPFQMYVTGYKYEEIASILEIPLGTVKNRIHITRKALQAQLNEYRAKSKTGKKYI